MLKKADIILTTPGSTLGKIILLVMRVFQKDPVKFSHTILAINEYTGIEAVNKIRYCNIKEELDKVRHYKVIRHKNLTDVQRDKISNLADYLEGLPYGTFRVVLQLIDHVTNTNIFTNLLNDNKSHICSSLIAWAYYVVLKYKFNELSWKSVDPDDIEDHILKYPGGWEIIKEK